MSEPFRFPARFYRDDPPHWTEGKAERPPSSHADAQARAALLVQHLLARCVRDSRGAALANRLAACRAGVRCLSGGCLVCARAAQRWVVDAYSKVLANREGGISVLSIIPTAHAPPGVETLTGDLAEAKNRILIGLENAGVSFCVGALDLSFNVSVTNRRRAVPCAHGVVIGSTVEIMAARRALNRIFPPSPSVPRPLRRSCWDGDLAGLAYVFKPEANRRVSQPRIVDEHGRTVRRANTHSEAATVEERIQAALAFDEIGLLDRLILRGTRVDIINGWPRLCALST